MTAFTTKLRAEVLLMAAATRTAEADMLEAARQVRRAIVDKYGEEPTTDEKVLAVLRVLRNVVAHKGGRIKE